MKHGGQGYVQARIDFFQANSSSSGNSVRYIQDPNDPGVLKEEASDAGSGSVTKIGWVVAPEAGYPATASMDITVGFTASETTADGDAATAESSMGPTGNLSFSTDAFDMSVGFSMIDISVGGEPVKTSTKFEGEISKSLESGMQLTGNASQTTIEGAAAPQNPAAIMVFGGSVAKSLDSLSLSASGSQTAYTPGEGTLFVPGAQSKNSLVFTASTTFDFGASLSGSFTYNTLAEYTKSVVNEVGEPNEDGEKPSLIVLAEGEEQIMSGTFKITPFEFFYAQATYAQTARAFASVTPPAMQIFFEASEPDLISKFVVEVGVSKSF